MQESTLEGLAHVMPDSTPVDSPKSSRYDLGYRLQGSINGALLDIVKDIENYDGGTSDIITISNASVSGICITDRIQDCQLTYLKNVIPTQSCKDVVVAKLKQIVGYIVRQDDWTRHRGKGILTAKYDTILRELMKRLHDKNGITDLYHEAVMVSNSGIDYYEKSNSMQVDDTTSYGLTGKDCHRYARSIHTEIGHCDLATSFALTRILIICSQIGHFHGATDEYSYGTAKSVPKLLDELESRKYTPRRATPSYEGEIKDSIDNLSRADLVGLFNPITFFKEHSGVIKKPTITLALIQWLGICVMNCNPVREI